MGRTLKRYSLLLLVLCIILSTSCYSSSKEVVDIPFSPESYYALLSCQSYPLQITYECKSGEGGLVITDYDPKRGKLDFFISDRQLDTYPGHRSAEGARALAYQAGYYRGMAFALDLYAQLGLVDNKDDAPVFLDTPSHFISNSDSWQEGFRKGYLYASNIFCKRVFDSDIALPPVAFP